MRCNIMRKQHASGFQAEDLGLKMAAAASARHVGPLGSVLDAERIPALHRFGFFVCSYSEQRGRFYVPGKLGSQHPANA